MGGNNTVSGHGQNGDDLALLIKDTEDEYYPYNDTSVYEDALCYQATKYEHLKAMAGYLKLCRDDVLVDFGCGKGRVIFFMAMLGLKKVIGVELRKELADAAREKIRRIKTVSPVEIYNMDAASFYCPDGTIFYMFNPFGGDTVKEVIGNIRKSIDANPRNIKIIYNNSVYGEYLNNSGWLFKEGRIPRTGIWVWGNRN